MPANIRNQLNQAKLAAVKMRLRGVKVAAVAKQTGLSAPTVIKCHKLFLRGGWQALVDEKRGRQTGQGTLLKQTEVDQLVNAMLQPQVCLWSCEQVVEYVRGEFSIVISERTASHLCQQLGLLWQPWSLKHLVNVAGRRALKRAGELQEGEPTLYFAYCRSVWLQLGEQRVHQVQLALQTPKHKRLWSLCIWPTEDWLKQSLTLLLSQLPQTQKGKRPMTLVMTGLDLSRAGAFKCWAKDLTESGQLDLLLIKPQHSLLPN